MMFSLVVKLLKLTRYILVLFPIFRCEQHNSQNERKRFEDGSRRPQLSVVIHFLFVAYNGQNHNWKDLEEFHDIDLKGFRNEYRICINFVCE